LISKKVLTQEFLKILIILPINYKKYEEVFEFLKLANMEEFV